MSKGAGRKIGAVFKEVHEVMIPQSGSKEGKHMKILVTISLDQPLLRGTTVSAEGTSRWVQFRYERCPDFCFKCGRVGHSYKSCREAISGEEGKNCFQYGSWLKTTGARLSGEGEGGRRYLQELEKGEEGLRIHDQGYSRTKGNKVGQREKWGNNGRMDGQEELSLEPCTKVNILITKEKKYERTVVLQPKEGKGTGGNIGNTPESKEQYSSGVGNVALENSGSTSGGNIVVGGQVGNKKDTNEKHSTEQGKRAVMGTGE